MVSEIMVLHLEHEIWQTRATQFLREKLSARDLPPGTEGDRQYDTPLEHREQTKFKPADIQRHISSRKRDSKDDLDRFHTELENL